MRTNLLSVGGLLVLLTACDSAPDHDAQPSAGAAGSTIGAPAGASGSPTTSTGGAAGQSAGGAAGQSAGGTAGQGTAGTSGQGAGGTAGSGAGQPAAGAAGSGGQAAGSGGQAGAPPVVDQVHSELARDDGSLVSKADRATVVDDNNAFAFSLYEQLDSSPENKGKNLFFSPISLTLALGMTSAGAVGTTQDEIHQAMHYSLPEVSLQPALNWLSLELSKRPQQARDYAKSHSIAEPALGLNIVDSVWGEKTYPWEKPYLDVLAKSYGAGVNLGDFLGDYQHERGVINDWVAYQTEQRITELLPSDAFDEYTRLVLVNAISLAFPWATKFDPTKTKMAPFTVEGGAVKQVQTMSGGQAYEAFVTGGHAEDALAQAVSLPLLGGQLSLVIYVPKAGQFAAFESQLATEVPALIPTSEGDLLDLTLPRFTMTTPSVLMTSFFQNLGMVQAFKDQGGADFSGMLSPTVEPLHVQKIFHKAMLGLDESGLQAAAATAVVVGGDEFSPQAKTVHIDRSFLVNIRDNETGATLFFGRIMDPTQP